MKSLSTKLLYYSIRPLTSNYIRWHSRVICAYQFWLCLVRYGNNDTERLTLLICSVCEMMFLVRCKITRDISVSFVYCACLYTAMMVSDPRLYFQATFLNSEEVLHFPAARYVDGASVLPRALFLGHMQYFNTQRHCAFFLGDPVAVQNCWH